MVQRGNHGVASIIPAMSLYIVILNGRVYNNAFSTVVATIIPTGVIVIHDNRTDVWNNVHIKGNNDIMLAPSL